MTELFHLNQPQQSPPPCAETLYLAHVIKGQSLRALARETGLNPSTVMRRVRKIEERREDPLVDQYFAVFDSDDGSLSNLGKDRFAMAVRTHIEKAKGRGAIDKDELRILRRLAEKDAVLVINQDLDKGVVLKAKSDNTPTRTAVVAKDLAMRLTLKEFIKLERKKKISVYNIR